VKGSVEMGVTDDHIGELIEEEVTGVQYEQPHKRSRD